MMYSAHPRVYRNVHVIAFHLFIILLLMLLLLLHHFRRQRRYRFQPWLIIFGTQCTGCVVQRPVCLVFLLFVRVVVVVRETCPCRRTRGRRCWGPIMVAEVILYLPIAGRIVVIVVAACLCIADLFVLVRSRCTMVVAIERIHEVRAHSG